MPAPKILERLHLAGGWSQEIAIAAIALALGFGLMPILIFFAGSLTRGTYEGAGVARIFATLYHDLGAGSPTAWIVVLGPYGLCLIFRGLWLWWWLGVSRN